MRIWCSGSRQTSVRLTSRKSGDFRYTDSEYVIEEREVCIWWCDLGAYAAPLAEVVYISIRLFFPQHQIHNPAPAHMRRGGVAAVVEDVVVVAPGVLERVGQNGHRAEVAGVVHLVCDSKDRGSPPSRSESDFEKMPTENITEQIRLVSQFSLVKLRYWVGPLALQIRYSER